MLPLCLITNLQHLINKLNCMRCFSSLARRVWIGYQMINFKALIYLGKFKVIYGQRPNVKKFYALYSTYLFTSLYLSISYHQRIFPVSQSIVQSVECALIYTFICLFHANVNFLTNPSFVRCLFLAYLN